MGAREIKPLLSDEHISVDGSLLQAWASYASLERIDGQDDGLPKQSNPGEGFGDPKSGNKRTKGNFRGIKLSNKTHRTTADRDAFLCRKSNVYLALPSYRGRVLIDYRHSLIVDCRVAGSGHGGAGCHKDYGCCHPWCQPENPVCRQELLHTGLRSPEATAWRDCACGGEHCSAWWLSDRQSQHPPQGLRQIDPCSPRDREGL
jgi:hypothetical protein